MLPIVGRMGTVIVETTAEVASKLVVAAAVDGEVADVVMVEVMADGTVEVLESGKKPAACLRA